MNKQMKHAVLSVAVAGALFGSAGLVQAGERTHVGRGYRDDYRSERHDDDNRRGQDRSGQRGYDRHDDRNDDRRGHDDRRHGGDEFGIGIEIREESPRVCEDRFWVEPVYRTVCDRVWVEPAYRTVCDRVWVEPVYETICDRVWVPAQVEYRDVVRYDSCGRRAVYREQVEIAPAHWATTERQVIRAEGHWQNVERQVAVSEGHWETIERQELVCAGRWEVREVVTERRSGWGVAIGGVFRD